MKDILRGKVEVGSEPFLVRLQMATQLTKAPVKAPTVVQTVALTSLGMRGVMVVIGLHEQQVAFAISAVERGRNCFNE